MAPRWSSDVHQADWIAPRLAPWEDEYGITIVVPAGFEAYARVLHPAETPDTGCRVTRWADVAAWCGTPLRGDAQFHSVALPPAAPGGPPPYDGHGPREGSLYGFGWDTASTYTAATEPGLSPQTPAEPARDPVPGPVRAGPRVHLPSRDYFLYQEPAEDVVTLPGLDGSWRQCPNIWWPADRAWCVASEIDLQWTYIGGPRALIDAVLADSRIEALPAAPYDPVSRIEDWVTTWADQLADGLMARGTASLSTARGSVRAWLRRPRGIRSGELRIDVAGHSGSAGTVLPRLRGEGQELRGEMHSYLTCAVLGLTWL